MNFYILLPIGVPHGNPHHHCHLEISDMFNWNYHWIHLVLHFNIPVIWYNDITFNVYCSLPSKTQWIQFSNHHYIINHMFINHYSSYFYHHSTIMFHHSTIFIPSYTLWTINHHSHYEPLLTIIDHYLFIWHSRILKWTYCTIFSVIFCGDIPLHSPKK